MGTRVSALNVYVYGDATGDGRHSSADQTDWQIVREFFRRHADLYRAQVRVRKENPSVKARVNAMNALLCNYHGERRLLVAPQCRQLIKDFERVCWTGDAHGNLLGNIDKSDPMRSHVSDALGYFVAQEFALLTNTPNIRQLCGQSGKHIFAKFWDGEHNAKLGTGFAAQF